jgi:hypothetical protein
MRLIPGLVDSALIVFADKVAEVGFAAALEVLASARRNRCGSDIAFTRRNRDDSRLDEQCSAI